jgi:hypothetical protein
MIDQNIFISYSGFEIRSILMIPVLNFGYTVPDVETLVSNMDTQEGFAYST